MTSVFDLSAEHIAALLATAAATTALCLAARLRPGRWLGPARAGLGVALVASEAIWIGWLVAQHLWTPAIGLPLHICDVATLLGAAALWSRRRPLVELLYFWACAGTVQALVTPAAPGHFPDLMYFQYYAAHGGIVLAAMFLVVGLRLTPGRGAYVRALLLTAGYAAICGLVDLATGGDYMYLRQPPAAHTLFDLMGPWPWYLVGATAIAIAAFALLAAPFRRLQSGG